MLLNSPIWQDLEILRGTKQLPACIDLTHGSRYVGYHTKSTNSKSENRQVGLHQTGKLCTGKERINRVKRQPTEQEKIFANHVSAKRLISITYKKPLQLNNKKQVTQLKNGKRILIDMLPQKTYNWPTGQ